MRLDFQQKIAGSTMMLPVVCAISVVLWLVLPFRATVVDSFLQPDYGLWPTIARALSTSAEWRIPILGAVNGWGWCMALAVAAVCVYLMAELNNRNALLRISSRCLSSCLALLCALTVSVHQPQPGGVLMLLTMVAMFPLFQAYQYPSPLLTLCVFTCISTASLVFPKALVLIPLYWMLQVYLRSFSFRCFISSLLGILTPWWVCFGVLFGKTSIGRFVDLVAPLASWHWYDYTQLTLHGVLPLLFFVLLFAIGFFDFQRNSFLDKTHTRSLLMATTMHGLYIIVFIVLQPQYLDVLQPLLLIDVAIMFGHFFALTYTRASHIVCLVLMVLAFIVFHYSYSD